MRWEEERYVRVYIRDTTEWISLSWEARAVFYEMMRKVDRTGFIVVGKSGLRGLSALLRIPYEVVQRGIEGEDGLLADGCVVAVDGGLCIPNYIEAQESKQSDRQRKAEQRARDRDLKLATGPSQPTDQLGQGVTTCDQAGQAVTIGHAPGQFSDDASRNVTDSHTRSQVVTVGHSVPCLPVPSQREDPDPEMPEKTPVGPPDPGGSVEAVDEPRPLGDAHKVFDAYVDGWRRARGRGAQPTFTAKRRSLILARLREHNVETVVAAARGIWLDPWHCADTNYKHVTPDLAMRDAAHVEKYAAFGAAPVRALVRVEDEPKPPPWRRDPKYVAPTGPPATSIGELLGEWAQVTEPAQVGP